MSTETVISVGSTGQVGWGSRVGAVGQSGHRQGVKKRLSLSLLLA